MQEEEINKDVAVDGEAVVATDEVVANVEGAVEGEVATDEVVAETTPNEATA